ncbi:MAG: oligopeptide transporter, OPT family [Coxiellaceae bacterium]|nr:oligopeptide transporter, OPT family [Coxiellaceae bacterium]
MSLEQKMKDANVIKPLYGDDVCLPEITVRAVIISIILAVVLAASNAYLALKIGATISASVPASILAIGILRFFKNSNVLESNIIQTAASAGEGVAAATAFILPAMIFLKVWTGFPFGQTVSIVIVGGLLGVLFSIPLRRVMLNMPTLKFPEGTAVGNVLRASASGETDMKLLGWGGGIGGLVSLCQTGFQIFSDNLQVWVATGSTVFGCGFGYSSASLAAGYIIGVEVAISLAVGLVMGWIVLIPILAAHIGLPQGMSINDAVMSLWSSHLRYVGVGTMIVGGIWTLLRLLRPVIKGVATSFSSLRHSADGQASGAPRTERDFPIKWVAIGTVIFAVLLFIILEVVLRDVNTLGTGATKMHFVNVVTVIGSLILGFVVSTVCAYFTGLVGSTNNPLSGIVILVVLAFSALYLVFFGAHLGVSDARSVAAMVILVTLAVATMGAVSNENLQDLKAGQMVGATPWKQQIMLGVGVVASALVLGPVLNLLFNAYGMAGVFPRPGMNHANMLAAPQSSLMAAIAQGVLMHNLEWDMIITGGVIAVVLIIIDSFLRTRYNRTLPALAVGLGIYLPPQVMMPIIIGGIVSYLVKRKLSKQNRPTGDGDGNHHQKGILLACGMVAGSAIMGVLLAIPFVIKGSSDALALVGSSFVPAADVLGTLVFIALCVWIYRTGISKAD